MRDFFRAVETLHDVVYFAPDVKPRYEALGLRGYWRGYFASRAGALGEASAELVTATFHGFAPGMVARAVPECWRLADREAVLDERQAIAADALDSALGSSDHDLANLAQRLGVVRDGVDLAGKPLAAAESTRPDPAGAAALLWRRATVLREFRGDVHVAVLTAAGLGGAEANVLQSATGRGGADQRSVRGWTEEEWATAARRLAKRGWLDDDGEATQGGREARESFEDQTDQLCRAFLSDAAVAAAGDLEADLLAASRIVAEAGVIPYPNPVGVPRP